MLIINHSSFEFVEATSDAYKVLKDGELKLIRKTALKSYDYSWQPKTDVQEERTNSFSPMNWLLVAGVVVIFLILNVLSRI